MAAYPCAEIDKRPFSRRIWSPFPETVVIKQPAELSNVSNKMCQ